jgi:hypothetical protein
VYKSLGLILVVLAVAIAVVPMFSDCQSQGRSITLANGSSVPMKCHWTGVAELATGVPLLMVGGMMVAARRKESYAMLSVVGIVLGAMVISLPTALIGVCSMPTMTCVTIEKPALIGMGALVVAGGLVGMIMSRRIKDNQ